MRSLIVLLMVIFLFTGIVLLADSEPKSKEKPVCPYTEKMEQSRTEASGTCPYSGKTETPKAQNVCPYSGKSLNKPSEGSKMQNEIEYKRSKQLLDEKLKIVIT